MLFRPRLFGNLSAALLVCVTMHVTVHPARPAFAGSEQVAPHAAIGTCTTQQLPARGLELSSAIEVDNEADGSDFSEDASSLRAYRNFTSPDTELLFRQGRRYDTLPKMDHFACKSDGLCIRPVGEKFYSHRFAVRRE